MKKFWFVIYLNRADGKPAGVFPNQFDDLAKAQEMAKRKAYEALKSNNQNYDYGVAEVNGMAQAPVPDIAFIEAK